MANDNLLEMARAAVKSAQAHGAREVGVGIQRSRQVEVGWRDGRLEKISEATTRALTLQLYVDQRYASVSTSDLRPEALDRFISSSVELTRTLAVDAHRALPDPALYAGQARTDLELVDPGHDALSAAERRKLAAGLEDAARAARGTAELNSVTGGCSDTATESVRVHSNGFEGTRRDTSFGMYALVSLKDSDGRRPQEAYGASARHRADLPSVAEIGAQATRRALGRLGARKIPSAVMTMVVENRVGGGLLGRLLAPLSASALQQKRSFLEGKVGTAVGGPLLDLADDPHLPRALGSRLFDGEGIASRRMPVFQAGVLRNFYVDNYYGRKLGMTPTTAGNSNVCFPPGRDGEEKLVAGVKDGVLVTGFLGGNSNATTGDFSLGVQGFRLRDGARAEPVSELNIAGNHLEFWKRLVAVGNDPYAFSALRTPTLVFEGVQFAGV